MKHGGDTIEHKLDKVERAVGPNTGIAEPADTAENAQDEEIDREAEDKFLGTDESGQEAPTTTGDKPPLKSMPSSKDLERDRDAEE